MTTKESRVHGPTLPISEEIHASKYRGDGEGFREAMNRVAGALTDGPAHYHEFREILLDMRFMPAGRVQTAMGSLKVVTPYNCFVSGTIEDSFVQGHGSIMQRAVEAATTMRMGGGIGYDFSTLRPKGALIKKLQSRSSGPISFMDIFDAVCRCVASSGHRRGAQMGVLRVDHPDIEEFIHAKQNATRLTGFNVSIAVTDEFMEAVRDGTPFDLRFGGEVHKTVDARALWEMIMRSTWDWAEPGVLFIDRINQQNNLWYCESIAATNPCGEQPLPPYGACLLGSFNLVKYLRVGHDGNGADVRYIDLEALRADVPAVVRAMDNVVDRAAYPMYEQEKEAKQKRRMGLGVTGLANALEACGYPYGSSEFCACEADVLATIRDACYLASSALAAEKGSFPLYDRDRYLSGAFIMSLPEHVRDSIRQHGIRNSHLTSIAPTGTISLAADNVSSGIEPVFSYGYDRTVNMPDGTRVERVDDYGVRMFGVHGKRTKDVTAAEHLAVLTTAQRYVDSAVSKTCNVSSSMPWADFKDLYMQAWEGGAKGCTTFQDRGKRGGILVDKDEPPPPSAEVACFIDPATGRRECQ